MTTVSFGNGAHPAPQFAAKQHAAKFGNGAPAMAAAPGPAPHAAPAPAPAPAFGKGHHAQAGGRLDKKA